MRDWWITYIDHNDVYHKKLVRAATAAAAIIVFLEHTDVDGGAVEGVFLKKPINMEGLGLPTTD